MQRACFHSLRAPANSPREKLLIPYSLCPLGSYIYLEIDAHKVRTVQEIYRTYKIARSSEPEQRPSINMGVLIPGQQTDPSPPWRTHRIPRSPVSCVFAPHVAVCSSDFSYSNQRMRRSPFAPLMCRFHHVYEYVSDLQILSVYSSTNDVVLVESANGPTA